MTTVGEWKEDFKSFINELQMPRDDYKGIMSYIDEGADLLKEQEPQSVVVSSNIYTGLPITHCPKCGFALDRFLYGREYQGEIKYCPMCGRPVKWDDK